MKDTKLVKTPRSGMIHLPTDLKVKRDQNIAGMKAAAAATGNTSRARPRSNVKTKVNSLESNSANKRRADWQKKSAERNLEKKAQTKRQKHDVAARNVRASTKRSKEPSTILIDDEVLLTAAESSNSKTQVRSSPKRKETPIVVVHDDEAADLKAYSDAAARADATVPGKGKLGSRTAKPYTWL